MSTCLNASESACWRARFSAHRAVSGRVRVITFRNPSLPAVTDPVERRHRTAIGNKRQKGGALLAVLWLSAALAAIAFSVASSVRSETNRVASSADGLRAWYLATGSVERAVQWMMWGAEVRNPDGSARWEQNLPRLTMSYPSGDAIVELIPESAKMNINTASPDNLMRVVTAVSGDTQRAAQIVAAILDWRGGS